MSNFLPPTTVAKTLAALQENRYVLPAIQREFVWSAEQVCLLFDSLLRGYPIGSFLFWAVDPKQAQDFRFYEFLTDYHEQKNPYAQVAHIPAGKSVTAVLDGQQRLTALNVGLYGSLAERLPRKWVSNPDAYPVKRLHLDLVRGGDDEDLSTRYRFRFLAAEEAAPKTGEPTHWYKVSQIMNLPNSGPAMVGWLRANDLLEHEAAYERLHALFHAVCEREALNAYEEDGQDPNTVLDIFVRVNRGGTQLSYSDLLLSMATNQWVELDAREEVRNLVDELNGSTREMNFSHDNVLKTALVLIDVPDIRFNVANFTRSNMAELEKQWAGVKNAMLLASRLLKGFGFSARTLTANSVIIPLAYYLYRRGATDSYLTSGKFAGDRAKIRTWVLRSLVKRGIWGSGLDGLLARQREAIRSAPADAGWPTGALEVVMAPIGKSLMFSAAEVGELTDLQYNSPRTFAVLALLYPGLDLSQQFHEDHIFPRSRFTASQLRRHGVPEPLRSEYSETVNGLANLQLLQGLVNIEKNTMWPWEWLASGPFPSKVAREHYVVQNDLDLLPESIDGFLEFYAARRERIERRLRNLLAVTVDERDAVAPKSKFRDLEPHARRETGRRRSGAWGGCCGAPRPRDVVEPAGVLPLGLGRRPVPIGGRSHSTVSSSAPRRYASFRSSRWDRALQYRTASHQETHSTVNSHRRVHDTTDAQR